MNASEFDKALRRQIATVEAEIKRRGEWTADETLGGRMNANDSVEYIADMMEVHTTLQNLLESLRSGPPRKRKD